MQHLQNNAECCRMLQNVTECHVMGLVATARRVLANAQAVNTGATVVHALRRCYYSRRNY
jgi:hypothetical protein